MNAPGEGMRDIMHKTEGRPITVRDHNIETSAEMSVIHAESQVIGPTNAGTAETVELIVRMDR